MSYNKFNKRTIQKWSFYFILYILIFNILFCIFEYAILRYSQYRSNQILKPGLYYLNYDYFLNHITDDENRYDVSIRYSGAIQVDGLNRYKYEYTFAPLVLRILKETNGSIIKTTTRPRYIITDKPFGYLDEEYDNMLNVLKSAYEQVYSSVYVHKDNYHLFEINDSFEDEVFEN